MLQFLSQIRWEDGTRQDMLDYMDNDSIFLDYEGEFDPNMCKKNYQNNTQTVLWCCACSCEQKQMGTLLNHIQASLSIGDCYYLFFGRGLKVIAYIPA